VLGVGLDGWRCGSITPDHYRIAGITYTNLFTSHPSSDLPHAVALIPRGDVFIPASLLSLITAPPNPMLVMMVACSVSVGGTIHKVIDDV